MSKWRGPCVLNLGTYVPHPQNTSYVKCCVLWYQERVGFGLRKNWVLSLSFIICRPGWQCFSLGFVVWIKWDSICQELWETLEKTPSSCELEEIDRLFGLLNKILEACESVPRKQATHVQQWKKKKCLKVPLWLEIMLAWFLYSYKSTGRYLPQMR